MGPKKKGKGSGDGAGKKGGTEAEKEEENQQKDRLTEVDKEWFNIQIRTLEDKLERRNEKMRNLEESNRQDFNYILIFKCLYCKNDSKYLNNLNLKFQRIPGTFRRIKRR